MALEACKRLRGAHLQEGQVGSGHGSAVRAQHAVPPCGHWMGAVPPCGARDGCGSAVRGAGWARAIDLDAGAVHRFGRWRWLGKK
jgi:L-aminopeptidase/D-esterase-like protein